MTTLANDVQVELSAALSDTDTSATIVAAVAPFNTPPAPDTDSVLTLVDTLGSPAKVEIVRYTTITDNGDGTFTIGGLARGQESTTAQSFDVGAVAYQAVTAGVLAALTTPEMIPAINAPQPGWLLGFGSATEFQWIDPATIGGGIRVDAVAPGEGWVDGETVITLEGADFDVASPTTVTVDGNSATAVSVDSSTQITATTPPGAAIGPADITVTQGSNSDTLSGAFEYTNWNPGVLTTTLWLKEEGTASSWTDHSGNEHHFTQANAGNQPNVSNKINGLTVRTFDGSDDFMIRNGVSFVTGSDMLVMVVAKQTVATPSVNAHILAQDPVFLLKSEHKSTSRPRFQPFLSGSYRTAEGSSSIFDTASIIAGVKKGSDIELYIDAVKVGSLSLSASMPSSAQDAVIGRFPGTAGTFFGGWIAEIVILSSWTAEDFDRLWGNFSHKWGLESNLPSGHPYKSSPP